MNDREALAHKIKRSLGLRALSYTQFARRLGINPSTVCHWCSGYAIPNHLHQRHLLDLLDQIDEENAHIPIILLRQKDFKPFNEALLAGQQKRRDQNRGNYLIQRKLIKSLTVSVFLIIMVTVLMGKVNLTH